MYRTTADRKREAVQAYRESLGTFLHQRADERDFIFQGELAAVREVESLLALPGADRRLQATADELRRRASASEYLAVSHSHLTGSDVYWGQAYQYRTAAKALTELARTA